MMKKRTRSAKQWSNLNRPDDLRASILSRLRSVSLLRFRSVSESWRLNVNLPDDLWPSILSRLPVKSLLRFRSVSESWRVLIDDPDFCRFHLAQFNNNRLDSHLFVGQSAFNTYATECVECVVRCSKTFGITSKIGFLNTSNLSSKSHDIIMSWKPPIFQPPGRFESFSKWWDVIHSIDGVFILRSRHHTFSTDLMLWNPSIRKVRILPPSPITHKARNFDVGLGFDPSIQDYKFLTVKLGGFPDQNAIAVYTVKSNSWRSIEFKYQGGGGQQGSCSNWPWDCDSYPLYYSYGMPCCIGGVVYFTGWIHSTVREVMELVSFDLTSEVFSSVILPEKPIIYNRVSTLMIDGGRSLAVVIYWGLRGSVWVLENPGANLASATFTKRYTFTLVTLPSFELYSNNGRYQGCRLLYLTKDGSRMFFCSTKRLISYDVETQAEETLLEESIYMGPLPICGYIESLILLREQFQATFKKVNENVNGVTVVFSPLYV